MESLTNDSIFERPSNDSIDRLSSFAVCYVIMGILLILTNLPIVGAVLKHPVIRYRKEYLIFAGMASADLFAGTTTAIAGLYRIYLWHSDKTNDVVSRSACVFRTLALSIAAISLQALMLLMVSVDRLVAVAMPTHYHHLTHRFSASLILSAYLLTGALTVVGLAGALADDPDSMVPASCVGSATVARRFFDVWFNSRLAVSLLSVLIYCLVIFLFRRHSRALKHSRKTSTGTRKRWKRQTHVTVTVGIGCAFTFIFYVLPTISVICARHIGTANSIAPYAWLLNCFNAVLNLFIYMTRHDDMRAAVRAFLLCKKPQKSPAMRYKFRFTVR
uniref:G-protein coupled receptors family 1 profile domain-containing protein n=1 Tax=Plectus sambesii TaxID=2011161 RepID=A0A914WM19_9BILA